MSKVTPKKKIQFVILQNVDFAERKSRYGKLFTEAEMFFIQRNMANRGKVKEKIKKNFKNCPKSPCFTIPIHIDFLYTNLA